MTMKIYDFPLSGHSHRVRLFASLINADVDIVHVDLAAGAHKTEEFLAMNPFGQVPVLEDGKTFISDSNAILVYLARKTNAETWLPSEPAAAAAIQRWLSVAAGDIAFGPAAARLITLFGASLNSEEVLARAARVLNVINAELVDRTFITGSSATIADVALYSYISSAPEGNVDLSVYPEVTGWLKRVESLSGFVPFQQSNVGLRAAI